MSTSPLMAASSTPCCSRLGGGAAVVSCRCRPPALPFSAPSRPFRRRVGVWFPTWRITSVPVSAASSSPSFDFSPPPIDYDDANLHDNLMEDGARDITTFTIRSFADDNMALDAANEGVVVADLTLFGRIRVTGEDRVNFLHNQSTANFNSLAQGEGCDTVFVTPTARTIELAHAWVMSLGTLPHAEKCYYVACLSANQQNHQ